MIRRSYRAVLEITCGVSLVALSVLLIRFGILPFISDMFGWAEETTSIIRHGLIISTVALVYWLFVNWSEKQQAQELALNPKPIILSAAAGVGVIGVPVALLFIDGSYTLQSIQFNPEILRVGLFIFAAAFLEEVIFRGMLFRVIEKHFGIITALIVPSFAFSLLHFFNAEWAGWISFTSGTLLGLFWALNFAWVRNIWSVAANHALWNFTIVFVGVPLTGQSEWIDIAPFQTSITGADWWSGGDAGPEDTLLTVAILAIVVSAMLWRQFRANGSVQPTT